MSSSSDTLRFRFPAHGDSILSRINTLREQRRFCDVTLLLGDPQGPAVRPLHFCGHRAVLAASSDFLRDQFLLHEDRDQLSVGIVSRVEVGEGLLLSCYTGLLEVPLRELVSYLTAASALQMTQVVEKCSQAISQYLSPTLASLAYSEEKEILQPESKRSGNRCTDHEEKDAAQPSTRILEASKEEGGALGIRPMSRFSKGATVDGQGLREVRVDKGADIAKIGLSEDAACCLGTLGSEDGRQNQPVCTNKPSYHHITGALRCKLYPSSAPRDHKPSTTKGVSAKNGSVDSFQNQDAEDQRGEKEMFWQAAQLLDPDLFCVPKSHCSGDELAGSSGGVLFQRPYLCRRCDRVFQHLESYVGHLKEHRQFLCLVCGKGFPQRSDLTRHIRVHTGVKLFRCPLCHKTFPQKTTLQEHLRLHTEDKPHECKYCAVQFPHKAGLRRHLKDIHGKGSLQNMLEGAVDQQAVLA